MAVEISLEIPLPHIKEFLPLTDFPFGLAQLVIENKKYRELMQGCLLDNGMYELGEPLVVDDLVRAATLANPVAVIAPDWEGDMNRTLLGVKQLYYAAPKHRRTWTIGALVQGKNPEERMDCFYALKQIGCSPIGFPFRSPRGKVIVRLHAESMFDEDGWYHLFGLRNNIELGMKLPGRWSLDTGKPFKGFRMDTARSIRGHGRLDLRKRLEPGAVALAMWNIAWMRKQISA